MYAEVYYSRHDDALPYNFTNDTIFKPQTNTSLNTTPYSQTNSIPIYNISGRNPDRNATLYVYINQTLPRADLWVSNTSSKLNAINLTLNRQVIWGNYTNSSNLGLWMWLDLHDVDNVSSIVRRLQTRLNPEGVCVGCL